MSSDKFRHPREKAAYLAGYEDAKQELGEQPQPLTHEQVAAMSAEEVDANWPRVQEVLRAGRSEGNSDDAE